VIKDKSVTAILLMAGNSTRYKKNINKNLEKIYEHPIIYYSINEFDKNLYVDNIILVVRELDKKEINKFLKEYNFTKNIKVILGGSTRKKSVYNALKSTNSDIVIIHDGARPAVRQEYINKCIDNIGDFAGVTIGVKSKDTIKITNNKNIVINTTKRSNTWIIQTPQCFDRNILLKQHIKYENEDVTDDCILLEKDDYKIKTIEGDYTNIKITTPEDLNFIRTVINK